MLTGAYSVLLPDLAVTTNVVSGPDFPVGSENRTLPLLGIGILALLKNRA